MEAQFKEETSFCSGDSFVQQFPQENIGIITISGKKGKIADYRKQCLKAHDQPILGKKTFVNQSGNVFFMKKKTCL